MSTFTEYAELDATGLAELIRVREVPPREVLAAAFAQADAWNPKINAIVYDMRAEALQSLESLDSAARFAGVPFLIKDLSIAAKGHPTTRSCSLYAGRVDAADSELMARFRRLGLVTFGKTNLPELGIIGVTESRFRGVCRNPWNLAHTPGGSSGGSAAAVAARIVPVAHADDGGGSIRIPASFTGLVGLKPTRGRVPLGPERVEAWMGLVAAMAVTRTVRDCAAVLDGVHGTDHGAPYPAPPVAESYAEVIKRPPGRLRIGFTRESLLGDQTHGDCARALDQAVRACESLGHVVDEARPVFDKDAVRTAFLTIVASCVSRDVEDGARALGRRPRRSDVEPPTRFLYLLGQRLPAADVVQALSVARGLGPSLASFHEKFDVWLTPTATYPPGEVGYMNVKWFERAALAVVEAVPSLKLMRAMLARLSAEGFERTPNTMIANMAGTPAISLPVSMSPAGLPIGVQAGAAYGREDLLLGLAAQLEAVFRWDQRRPGKTCASPANEKAPGGGPGAF